MLRENLLFLNVQEKDDDRVSNEVHRNLSSGKILIQAKERAEIKAKYKY